METRDHPFSLSVAAQTRQAAEAAQTAALKAAAASSAAAAHAAAFRKVIKRNVNLLLQVCA